MRFHAEPSVVTDPPPKVLLHGLEERELAMVNVGGR